MEENATNEYKKLPSCSRPESRQLDVDEEPKAEKAVGKAAELFKRFRLMELFMCLLAFLTCIAALFGYIAVMYTMFGFLRTPLDPQAPLDRDFINLFTRIFFFAPVYILWRKQREYYAPIMFVLVGLLFPYCSLGAHAISMKGLATIESMTLLLNCALSWANIFVLPVYVLFIRNGEVEDADADFKDKRDMPTFAEVKAYMTPLCIYYALIVMFAALATSTVQLGKIESETLLHTLAVCSWLSVLACFPLHFSRTVNARRWLSIFFLVLVPLVIAVVLVLDAYEICSLGSMMTPMYELQSIFWFILMWLWLVRTCCTAIKAKRTSAEIRYQI